MKYMQEVHQRLGVFMSYIIETNIPSLHNVICITPPLSNRVEL